MLVVVFFPTRTCACAASRFDFGEVVRDVAASTGMGLERFGMRLHGEKEV